MKICTLSVALLLSLTVFISYSTVIGMVAQPPPSSQRIDRIDFYYGYGHGHQQEQSPEESSSQVVVKTLDGAATGGALPLKNKVKGPADLGIYFINSAGRSCGGLSTAQCSQDCGALGYPVYWCYPKVCFCHYGASQDGDEGNELEPPTF